MLGVNVLVEMVVVVIVLIERRFADDDAQRIQLTWDVARPSAIATPPRRVFLRRCALRQHTQQRGSCRSSELARSRRSVPDVESFEQSDGRRRWYRQHAVSGFHRAVAERHFRVVDPFDAK